MEQVKKHAKYEIFFWSEIDFKTSAQSYVNCIVVAIIHLNYYRDTK